MAAKKPAGPHVNVLKQLSPALNFAIVVDLASKMTVTLKYPTSKMPRKAIDERSKRVTVISGYYGDTRYIQTTVAKNFQ